MMTFRSLALTFVTSLLWTYSLTAFDQRDVPIPHLHLGWEGSPTRIFHAYPKFPIV